MARRDLFQTDTVNFLELIGNGKRYSVPIYQRDYSWGEEQWEDLWNDIVAIRNDPNARHYMGAIVVEEKSDRDFLVIDGQQRLATLSILAICVVDALRALVQKEVDADKNRERADRLWNTFVGETDLASLVKSSKLTLNENDDGFYQDVLVQGRIASESVRLAKSNRALNDARAYFAKEVAALSSMDGEVLAQVLAETVARGLFFILITVENEGNAYTIFETLNARGLELSTTDLLKNYLFSRMKPGSELAHVQRRWKSLVAATTPERFPEFLRYHLLVKRKQVRKERLFKIVREEVPTAQDTINLINILQPRATVFEALSDPRHPYWSTDTTLSKPIEDLNLFGVRQITPLVFAITERFSPRETASVLRMLVVLSFRYTIVGGRNPSDLETAYHLAAAAVVSGKAQTPKDVFETLRDIYVPDDSFGSEFQAWSVGNSRRKLAKYVLARFEEDVRSTSVNPTTDPGTVEHILPDNPDAFWAEAIPPEAWERTVQRVGNLTLLEASANRKLGNASYAEKVEAYAASAYRTTRAVAESAPEEWTLAHIEERQRRQAARAVHLWRVDF